MEKPEKTTGIKHVLMAAKYSYAGFLRMMGESAFRSELLYIGAIITLLILCEADRFALTIALLLAALLLVVETLNTALEEIIDHLSPNYSDFAKVTKDLGSFAVFILLVANGVHGLFAILY